MSEDKKNKNNSSMSWIIKFSSDELTRFPNTAAALAIFIPAVQKCYEIWNPAEKGMDEKTFETNLLRCSASAAQVNYNQQQQTETDISVLEEMNIPDVIKVVLTLAAAYEKCQSIWEKEDFNRMEFTQLGINLIHLIGLKMYRKRS